MKDGFIRVAAATPEIQVADCRYNREQIEKMMVESGRGNGCISGALPDRLYMR